MNHTSTNTMGFFKLSFVDFSFTCVGLLCLMADVVLDIIAAVSFYQDGAYVSLGLLLLFLVGSSVLVQVYSWLWYSYEEFQMDTKIEKSLGQKELKLLHIFQLGIYVRHAGVMETSVCSFFKNRDNSDRSSVCGCFTYVSDPEDYAVYLGHDLSLLRLIETFSEGAPQFVLMLTLILQQGDLDLVTVLKAIGSASAIAVSVTMYHRCLRSFLPDKKKQNVVSSVIYFLWNVFLISSRLTALALFASVMPCFIFAHFCCSWLVLVFFAFRSKTDLMDTPCGEQLYRATVALIWYFDWFNVVEGKTRNRTLLYHSYILADISLLCGLWYWKMSTEPPYFEIPHLYAVITAVSVVGVYILGLLFKIIYYKWFHPNLAKQGGGQEKTGPTLARCSSGQPEAIEFRIFAMDVIDGVTPTSAPAVRRDNKRMRKLAQNFYS